MFHPELNLIANLGRFLVNEAKDSAYISLKNVHRAFLVVIITQGAVATQHTLTVKQATAGAGTTTGTSEKALLVNSPVYYNQNCALSNLLTLGTATLGVYTTDTEATRTKMVVFDIVPERDMDIANGFDCIGLNTSDFGASCTGGVFAILIPTRYAPMATVYAD
jgi:hypothetical protein